MISRPYDITTVVMSYGGVSKSINLLILGPGQGVEHYALSSLWDRSSIGRVFRPPLRRRRKMAALPLPAAILDDLISSFRFREWGHPRWRPEAEGPPSCASASMGVEKLAPGSGWRHFRRRHLESKMAAVEMTSGGRRDAREDVLQTSAPSMSPVEVWLYFLVRLKK